MSKKIDVVIAQKFATAAGVLMTRVFSTPLEANPRRLAFAAGPVASHPNVLREPHPKFDVLHLGFRPGREWKGPAEIHLEELREGEHRTWKDCRFWTADLVSPMYLLTADPEVCFSFDGNSLITLLGRPDNHEEGIRRARDRLRAAAKLVPDHLERRTMM